MCFAEDELVSLDELQEKVQDLEDYVQSSDVAAMQSKFGLTKGYTCEMLMITRRALNILHGVLRISYKACLRIFCRRIVVKFAFVAEDKVYF